MARDQRTNRRIKAREVRVVGPAGEQLGVLSIEQALAQAQELGFDLVEVSPMAKPPVCKIMDYGKFKYEEKKKASEAKKRQVVVHVKEIKLRPKTEEHDYDFKIRNVRRFLEEGNKAKVTIMFRGREITHKELGQAILDDVTKDTKDIGVIEQAPRMEGRAMFMILAPNPKVAQRAREAARQAALKLEAAKKAAPQGGTPPHAGHSGGAGHDGGGHKPPPKDGDPQAAAPTAPAAAPAPAPSAQAEPARQG